MLCAMVCAMPTHPTQPDASDLDTFRARTLAAMHQAGYRSQRKLEDRLGWARGSLSKLFHGKTRLSHKMLVELAQALKQNPGTLVDATGYASLIETAPPTPESSAVAALRSELDEARMKIAARDAELAATQAQLAARADEVSKGRMELAQSISRAEGAESQLRDARTEATQLRRASGAAGARISQLEADISGSELKIAALDAELTESRRQAGLWRGHALERVERVRQLEQALKTKGKDLPAALLFGGLLGMTLGASGAARR